MQGNALARRLAVATSIVVATSLWIIVAAAPALAVTGKVRHWPETYVRHLVSQRVADGTPAFEANLRGDIATAGNTLETCPDNLSASGSEPCVNTDNNGQNMKYVNVDPGPNHERFDSSTATLSVPAGARVVKAYLYWAADLSRGVTRPPNDASNDAPGGDSPQTNSQYTSALLRAGGGSYANIDATAAGRDGRWDYVQSWYSQPGNATGWAYQVRADVTPEINQALVTRARRTRSGQLQVPVTVANVQAGTGYNRYAGWNLVVVWETNTDPWRNITLFDGFAFVQVQNNESLVVGPLQFSGFQTPSSGNVGARITTWATEGDRTITGDYLALGKTSQSCSDPNLKRQSDATHDVGNFFRSTISSGGVTVGGRTPGYNNQLGFDFSTLSVPEGTIPNGATGASVCLGTVGDTYFFGGIAFSTLIYAPNLAIAKTADHTAASPGDVVTYSTTVSNPATRLPTDPLFGTPVNAATHLVTADPLPSGLDFVAFTNNPGGACSYNPATRTVSCNVGTLQPDATFTYAYQARVDAVAQGSTAAPLTNVACYLANSVDQPDTQFTGCDPASVTVPPAPPVPADLGVVKTVSHDVVAPGDTITWKVVATNYGPATATGVVLADQLPSNVTFVSASATAPLTCTTPPVGGTGAITCTAPSMPAAPASGSSLTLTIVATVPSTAASGSVIFNVATVAGDQAEPTPDPHPNRDTTLTRVETPSAPIPPPEPLPTPDPEGPPIPPVTPIHPPLIPGGAAGTRMAVHKTVTPKSVVAGSDIIYTLRVVNTGDASALSVRVCDTTPAGFTVVSAPGFRRTAGGICTTISSLRTQTSRTYHLTLRAGLNVAGHIANRVTATASNAPTARGRATVRVIRPPTPPQAGLGGLG